MVIPSYILRYSKRARYLQLRLSRKGLEVVIPSTYPYSNDAIEAFIQKKQAWISKHSPKVAVDAEMLPTTINLEAIGQIWKVNYLPVKNKKLRLVTYPGFQIILIGNMDNAALCLQLIKKWLKRMAQEVLPQELHRMAAEIGLPFKNVSIRYNLTRWGSCSTQKNINLCCKLLLIPRGLMRHVLWHELCHTKYMHHGTSFWSLLETFDSHAKSHAKALKIAAKKLPAWVCT